MSRILAIDPGNLYSGYVLVEFDKNDITKVLDAGKIDNDAIFDVISNNDYNHLAIEMIASMGMAVGAEVFETCVWIGKFMQYAEQTGHAKNMRRIYRREEKLDLCGNLSAKDANIRLALVDRYAPGQPNYGKGSKKQPGFFYGIAADMWAAMAIATTYYDLYIKQVRL